MWNWTETVAKRNDYSLEKQEAGYFVCAVNLMKGLKWNEMRRRESEADAEPEE
jgi:hypothetical protein